MSETIFKPVTAITMGDPAGIGPEIVVGTMLDKARYSNSLSSKLTAHLQRIDRTDLIPYIQYDTKHGKGGI